jgi:hypothetical protein
MRTFIAALFASIALSACVSNPPAQVMSVSPDDVAPESERTLSLIGDAPGQTKDEIFASARLWLAESFRSSKAVIELEDKAEGIIVGNGMAPYPLDGCEGMYCSILKTWGIRFKVKIEVKDARYRMTFTDLELYAPPTYGTYGMPATQRPLIYKKELAMARADLTALAKSLATFSAKAKADKNW